MHPTSRIVALIVGIFLASASNAAAATAKAYQVTGPIVALTPTVITIQKGDEKWEITRDPSAKGDAELKVGNRVTVHYRMTVTSIETKDAKTGAHQRTESEKAAVPNGKK